MYIIIVIKKKMFNETRKTFFQSLSLSRTTKIHLLNAMNHIQTLVNPHPQIFQIIDSSFNISKNVSFGNTTI